MKERLTDALCAKAPAGELWDELIPDLYLRVGSKTRTWMVRYYISGKRIRKPIGTFPKMRVAVARDTAVLAGAKARSEDRERGEGEVVSAGTFGSLAEAYLKSAGQKLATTTRKEWGRLVTKEIIPALGELPANDTKRLRIGVRSMITDIATRSVHTSNRSFEVARRIYHWAVGQDLVQPGPVFAGLEPVGIEEPRERILTDEEIRKILAAADLDYRDWRAFWKLLFYTGARKGTVLAARWEQFDLSAGTWAIPSESLKGRRGGRRDVVVPLPKTLVEALEAQREATGRHLWVTSNLRTGERVQNPQKAADRIRDISGTSGWHVHDIRRTVSSTLARLGVEPHIIDFVLAHRSGGRIHRVYNRYEYFNERRAALETLADFYETLKQRA